MKVLLGKKKEMTQTFTKEGRVVPVTIVAAGPVTVLQVKTKERDGYEALQVGFGEQKEQRLTKAQKGHMKDKGFFKYVREFRFDGQKSSAAEGDSIDVSVFEEGDNIRVSAISKGKGFQGVVKRWNFAGGPKSHGQKHTLRTPGSIGATGPQRVFKGLKMAGRTGGDRITVKNLEVVRVDKENNLLYIKGAVPGRRDTLVEIVSL